MNDERNYKETTMSRARVTLPMRLTGIARAREVQAAPTPPVSQAAQAVAAAPTAPPPATDVQGINQLANEFSKLTHALHGYDREAAGAIARAAVQIGIAVAERLLYEALAADRQRLDRAVLGALERMQPTRQVVVHGHAADLALLRRQMDEHADLESFRHLMTLQVDETCNRGQWKLDSDDWFMEWDTQRGLTELRELLIEETYSDDQ